MIPRENVKEDSESRNNASRIYTTDELIAIEKSNIIRALKLTKWKISGKNGAAELLQLPATTLASKIKALKIERPI